MCELRKTDLPPQHLNMGYRVSRECVSKSVDAASRHLTATQHQINQCKNHIELQGWLIVEENTI